MSFKFLGLPSGTYVQPQIYTRSEALRHLFGMEQALNQLGYSLTPRAYDDLYPTAVSVGSGVNKPSFTTYEGNLQAYEFVGVTLTKQLIAEFQFTHGYAEGTDIVPHVHLYIPDDATGGDVKLSLEYTWDNVGDTGGPSSTTLSGTVTRTASQGISRNQIVSFGTVDGTGMSISSILSARLYRDPTDVADTFGSSVWLRSLDIHIIEDALGSREQISK